MSVDKRIREARLARMAVLLHRAEGEAVALRALWEDFGEGQPEAVDIACLGPFARFADNCGLTRFGRPSMVALDAAAREFVRRWLPELREPDPAQGREVAVAEILRGAMGQGRREIASSELRDAVQASGCGWRDNATAGASLRHWLQTRGMCLRSGLEAGMRPELALDDAAHAFVVRVLGECPAPADDGGWPEFDVEPMGDLIHAPGGFR